MTSALHQSLSNPRVLLAHPGTQHSHLLAQEFEQNGLLGEFWTGFALSAEFADTFLRSRTLQSVFSKRIIRGIPRNKLRTVPFNELRALASLRLGVDAQWSIHRRNERFQNAVRRSSLQQSDVVVGFDTCSWLLAARCKRAGIPFILEQTTPHPNTKADVFQYLEKNFPEWSTGYVSKPPELIEIELQEHRLADRIVVPSTYTRRSLVEHGADPSKIRQIPFGVDTRLFHPGGDTSMSGRRPMRFIYAGQITGTKGIPVLLEAWKEIPRGAAELFLVGNASPSARKLISEFNGVTHVAPVPHKELAQLLSGSDVFVFPSFYEGLARVILESMACGLPVIASTASGACDVIQPGENGLLIEAGDVGGLTSAINQLISHPEKLPAMKKSARARAEEFTWARYGEHWQALIEEVL
jgi:glycosyltransferase involved in cell wall biosynthesis